ncbi:hypothetical protein [Companilactobacillus keshanensis]|uniref:Uncharacterized protein n=1 Tax=Companilactobacillus keshanensis TaxID=2486003 RepID=A0ABW4BVX3_9LACO|nr:hypothetical protein [Companilactobacillus keshanensis]
MNNRKLIVALLEFISYHIFPISFLFTHGLNNYSINFYLLVMVAMIAFYKEYVRTLKPNFYFNGLYSVCFFILAFISYRTLNINVIILAFVQLVFLYLTKYISKKYQILETLIDNFIIPSFTSIAIAYTYAHFISVNFVVPLLLVNISAILIDYFDGEIADFIQLVTLAGLTLILFFLGYVNIITAVTIVIFVVASTLLKEFRHISVSNLVYRLIGNILLLI